MTKLIMSIIAILLGLLALGVALGLFAIVFPMVLVASLSKWLTRLLEPKCEAWGDLIEYSEEFGWKPVANMRSWHEVEDVFQVTTDNNGWRGSHTLEESGMLVFGDSFAWGYGVHDKDFFADLVKSTTTKSVGCVGYNMVQELMWMEKYAQHMAGKVVVWMVYLGNDPFDNLNPHMDGYRTPFLCKPAGEQEWQIRTDHISEDRWFYRHEPSGALYLEKVNELCRPGYYSDRAFEACEDLIARGKALCDNIGARLVVVSVPERSQYDVAKLHSFDTFSDINDLDPDLPDKALTSICDRHQVPFYATLPIMDLSYFKATDCHWNEQGHLAFAELLDSIYADHINKPVGDPKPSHDLVVNG